MKRQGTVKISDLQIIAAIADHLMHTKVPAHCSSDAYAGENEKDFWCATFLTQAHESVPLIQAHSKSHVSMNMTGAVKAGQRDLDLYITCDPRC